MAVLVVEKLRKVYPGGVEALRGVSFSVDEGEIYGLVGPNGAGKSTAFKVVATLLKPSSGRVAVDGVDVVSEPLRARAKLAFVPEEVGGYRRLTGWEFLEFVVRVHMGFRGASRSDIEAAIEEAAKIAGLPEDVLRRVKMGEYSKGMKRRVQVAWALAVAPRLAILDEPTSGLDVEASYELRSTIKRYARSSGVTVLMSSHNMLEVETVCDRVALIRRGLVLEEGSPQEIKERYGASNLEEAYMAVVSEAS
ncbi:MAG: ABC transporter ATP-binding protein [Thermoproteota archaeon]